MCSVESLRHFMSDRLTVAAGEIFTEIEKTIVRYQEEIDRQRRLLDIIWKPHIPLQSIELPQSYVYQNVKTVVVHQPHDQERKSMVDHDDPESLQIKDEQEELWSSQEEEQLGLKQENDNFVVPPAYEESDHNEPKPNSEQILFHISCAAESPDQEGSKDVDSGSTGCVNLMPGHQSTSSDSRDVDKAPMSERHCDNDKEKKSLTCELCGKTFGRKSNLKRHHRIHTGERPYSCDICGKSFRQWIHLKNHMRCHTELPQSYVCENEKTVIDHQPHDQERNSMVDHDDPEPLWIKDEQEELCASLEQSNPELAQIKKEEEEFCTSLNQSNTELPLIKIEQEELCSSQEEEQLELKQETDNFVMPPAYEESDHNEPKPNSDWLQFHISCAAESPDQEGSKNVDSGSNGCVSLMSGHQSTSSDSNDVDKAPMSERQCDNGKAKKSATCEFCGKTFRHKSDLMRHQRTHTDEKPYSCNICGKSFRQQTHVKSHMRSHTGEKPYVCNTCGKRFTDSSYLKVHMRSHTGEKPYSCKTCRKSFISSGYLRVHMRSHTGEKPYVCNTCGKRFNDNCSLKVHIRRHTGEKPYSCKICRKSFSRRGSVRVHMRLHTGEKTYSCNISGKRFSRVSTRYRHMTVHKEKSHVLVKHVEKASFDCHHEMSHR